MSFGRVFGAALQGIGAGMAAGGRMEMEAKAEAAKQDAITRREQWIESTRHNNKVSELQTASQLNREEQTNQADLADRNDARKTSRGTASQIAIDNARTKNDIALAKVQSGLQLNRETALKQQEFTNQITMMGKEVDRFERRADGAMVAFSKSGSVISVSPPGLFPPAGGSGGTDDGSGLLTGATGSKPLPTTNIANRPPLASFQQ